jgi:ParB family transcriptional regulator, chromosome partitioning protein
MKDDVEMISIERIRILNPRHRDRKKFEMIVQSIRNLGLKKPIQVSLRSTEEAEGAGYDLVCGQGRIEAFTALGRKEIPAIVVEVSKEDRLLRSLIENMARRFAPPVELVREIVRLKARGYSNTEIAKKLDIPDGNVKSLLALSRAGEERLLEAATSERIPLGVAVEIARTSSIEAQRELLKAYESNQMNHASIRTVKRLIEQRRFFGKARGTAERETRKTRTSAEGMVKAYKSERLRQRVLIRKAKICSERLVFIVTAWSKLLGNENFMTLLRAESLATAPAYLCKRFETAKREEKL